MTADPQQLPLRDIHFPNPVGLWPPAPGWWLVLVVLIALAVLGLWFWQRQKALNRPLKSLAKAQLERVHKAYRSHRNRQRLVQELSVFLRRVSISCVPRERVAGLTGEAWLNFLDQMMHGERFYKGVGRVLLDSPYKTHAEFDAEALLVLCQDWIESLPEKAPR